MTQALKALAAGIDVEVGGKGAAVVSTVVAVGLMLVAYGSGWVPVNLPACQAAEPFACVQG